MSCGYTTAVKYFLWEHLPLLKYILQKTMGIIATSRFLYILQAVRLLCSFFQKVVNILVEKSVSKDRWDPKWRPVIQCTSGVPSANLKKCIKLFLTTFLYNTAFFPLKIIAQILKVHGTDKVYFREWGRHGDLQRTIYSLWCVVNASCQWHKGMIPEFKHHGT